jgi:hypothetical protein
MRTARAVHQHLHERLTTARLSDNPPMKRTWVAGMASLVQTVRERGSSRRSALRYSASAMSHMLLLVFLFVAWGFWAWAAMSEKTVSDTRVGLPRDQHGHVSIVPVIPLFPLVLWGVAVFWDKGQPPWGTRIIGSLHAALIVACIISIALNRRRLRAIRNAD